MSNWRVEDVRSEADRVTDTQLFLHVTEVSEELNQVQGSVVRPFSVVDAALQHLLPCDRTAFAQVVLQPAHVTLEVDEVAIGRLAPRLGPFIPKHPFVRRYAGSSNLAPQRLSDLVNTRTFRNSEVYDQIYRPAGASCQMLILTAKSGSGHASCWLFNRSKGDFSDAELCVGEQVQPLLAAMTEVYWPSSWRTAPVGTEHGSARAAEVGVTAREYQTLELMAQTLTADAIAHIMRVSRRTVDKHRENLYRKIGAYDRMSAIYRGQSLGLLSGRPPSEANLTHK